MKTNRSKKRNLILIFAALFAMYSAAVVAGEKKLESGNHETYEVPGRLDPTTGLSVPAMQVVVPEDLAEQVALNRKTMAKERLIDKSSEPTRAAYIMQKMSERRTLVEKRKSRNEIEPETFNRQQTDLGFLDLNNDYIEFSKLNFQPTLLSKRYLNKASQSYLVPSGQKLQQLHTDTLFGTLIIDEMQDAVMSLDQPNITVQGVPATLANLKHKGGEWATVIYAPAGKKLFVVEVDRKLNRDDEKKFIGMVEELVSNQ